MCKIFTNYTRAVTVLGFKITLDRCDQASFKKGNFHMTLIYFFVSEFTEATGGRVIAVDLTETPEADFLFSGGCLESKLIEDLRLTFWDDGIGSPPLSRWISAALGRTRSRQAKLIDSYTDETSCPIRLASEG
jgi:hypothetical protein